MIVKRWPVVGLCGDFSPVSFMPTFPRLAWSDCLKYQPTTMQRMQRNGGNGGVVVVVIVVVLVVGGGRVDFFPFFSSSSFPWLACFVFN